MRTTLTLLLGASAMVAGAQLVNGSFEDGLVGWNVENSDLSMDAAPGQGSYSLRIPSSAPYASVTRQIFGGLEEGMVVHLSGWAKGHNDVVWEDTMFGLCSWDTTGSSNPQPQLALVVNNNYWNYYEGTMTLGSANSYCVFMSGTNIPGSTAPDSHFDGLSLVVDPSTGAPDKTGPDQPHFRPNPVTDKLWIDLPVVPLSITAIDASGRTYDLKNFTHRERTLEVDVDALHSGICLLRLTTASGTRTIRFVKA